MVYDNSMNKDQFKEFKNLNKWTQEQMANALGVKQQRISDWENGKRKIPLYIEKLIECLGKK